MKKVLEGIRVLDLTQYQAGPVCTMLLADMGGEVIKVEPPWGDPMRFLYPVARGESVYFLALNRNKKSITLNLKSEKGVDIFKDLVRVSDVVVENFSAGTMNRLGIGYETLKKIKPKIIYASLSGFGQYGPYSKRLSFDIIAQATSGFMSLTAQNVMDLMGSAKFPPVLTAEAIGDSIPGMMTTISVLAALYHRKLTGRGQRIDVSQQDSLIYVAPSIVAYSLSGKTLPQLQASFKELQVYNVFRARDGYVVIAAPLGIMDRLAKVIGKEKVDDEQVKRWVRDRSVDEVVNTLLEAKVAVAPVLDMEKVIADPHVQAREMIVEVDHPKLGRIKVLGFAPKLSETPGGVELPPPLLGQHTEDVLSTLLGYTKEEIIKLREEKVL